MPLSFDSSIGEWVLPSPGTAIHKGDYALASEVPVGLIPQRSVHVVQSDEVLVEPAIMIQDSNHLTQSDNVSIGFSYTDYALVIDFKNGAYWKEGTQYASLAAMPGYVHTRSGAKGEESGQPISYGPELVTNGDGSTTVGWTAGADAILSSVGGRLRITVDADGVSSGATAYQPISVAAGVLYRLTGTIWASQSGRGRIHPVGLSGIHEVVGNGPTLIDFTVYKPDSGIDLYLGAASGGLWADANEYAEFDNVSITRQFGGSIEYFAANEPGIVPGVGYWARRSITNMLLHSRDLTQAAWTKRGTGAVVTDGTMTVDGVLQASKITVTSNNNDIFQSSGVISGTATPSLFAKQSSTSGIITLQNAATGPVGGEWDIDLSLLSGSWERLTPGHPAVTVVTPFSYNGSSGIHLVGDGTARSLYVDHVQLLPGDYVDSGPVIVTTGATATIGGDTLELTHPITIDEDFLLYAVVDFKRSTAMDDQFVQLGNAGGNRITLYREQVSRNAAVNSVGGTGGVRSIASNITTGRAIIAHRRRGGKDTTASRFGGTTLIGAESGVTSWATPSTTMFIGHYFSDYQPDAPIESVFIQRGSFTDVEVAAILEAV